MDDEFNLSRNTKRIFDRRKVRAVFIENANKEAYRIIKEDDGFLYLTFNKNGKTSKIKLKTLWESDRTEPSLFNYDEYF